MSTFTKLKRVTTMRAGGTPPVDDPSMWANEGLPWVSIGDMTKAVEVRSTNRHLSPQGRRSKHLPVGRPGTVLFAMYASVGTASILGTEASWNQAILGINPVRELADARFVKYWLEHLRPDLMALIRSNTQDNLNAEQVGNLPFPVVPLAVQTTIANYLDHQTETINELWAAKQRLAELLDCRYWSTVTQEIESKSPRYIPLRRVITRIIDGPFGSALKSSDYADAGARVVRLGNIGQGFFRDNDVAFVSSSYFQTLLRYRVLPGDLLIAGLGDNNNPVGRACVAPDLGAALVKADCYCASIDEQRADVDFLALFLSSPLGQSHTAIAARGTTRSRINLDIARDIAVPDMPLSEQREIVATAANLKHSTDTLKKGLEWQITLLKEYRQSLITAAVTGQLDIPEPA